jgi:hypothetical protein
MRGDGVDQRIEIEAIVPAGTFWPTNEVQDGIDSHQRLLCTHFFGGDDEPAASQAITEVKWPQQDIQALPKREVTQLQFDQLLGRHIRFFKPFRIELDRQIGLLCQVGENVAQWRFGCETDSDSLGQGRFDLQLGRRELCCKLRRGELRLSRRLGGEQPCKRQQPASCGGHENDAAHEKFVPWPLPYQDSHPVR